MKIYSDRETLADRLKLAELPGTKDRIGHPAFVIAQHIPWDEERDILKEGPHLPEVGRSYVDGIVAEVFKFRGGRTVRRDEPVGEGLKLVRFVPYRADLSLDVDLQSPHYAAATGALAMTLVDRLRKAEQGRTRLPIGTLDFLEQYHPLPEGYTAMYVEQQAAA